MRRFGLLALTIAACGGTAIVDPPDGAGGASSTSSSGGTTSSAGGAISTSSSSSNGVGGAGASGGCSQGFDELTEAVLDAQACDPLINAIQCSGMTVVLDGCGCAVVANDFNQEQANEALGLYDEWVGEGCGPYDCESCPPPPDSPWYCDPMLEQCLPAYD